jgi:hypothetical protein
MAMSVFTVFFCGTCSNSYDFMDGETASTLACNHAGMEFVAWIIADGPGSGQDGHLSYNRDLDGKWTEPGYYTQDRGITFGSGWEENVSHAMAVIKGSYTWSRTQLTKAQGDILEKARIPINRTFDWGDGNVRVETTARKVTPQALQQKKVEIFRKNRGPISRVNAIGWSRGAITCHMLANALANDPDTAKVKVNIFAIDPVPGPRSFQKHRTNLPSNVREYFGVFARDERLSIFIPSVPELARSTKGWFLPMPGVHSTLSSCADRPTRTMARQPDGTTTEVKNAYWRGDMNASGRVIRHLAETHLTRWGTPMNKTLDYDEYRLLALYDNMLKHDSLYQSQSQPTSKGGWGKPVGQGGRLMCVGQNWTNSYAEAIQKLKFDVNQDIFVNWHHRELFIHRFNDLWNVLFARGQETRRYKAQVDALCTRYPQLAKNLGVRRSG